MNTIENLNVTVSAIDQLGEIRAQMAELKKLEEKALEAVKLLGVGAFEGEMFRAAVSQVEDRQSLDVKVAEEKLRELGVDGRWFSKNMKTTRGYVAVRVSARKA